MEFEKKEDTKLEFEKNVEEMNSKFQERLKVKDLELETSTKEFQEKLKVKDFELETSRKEFYEKLIVKDSELETSTRALKEALENLEEMKKELVRTREIHACIEKLFTKNQLKLLSGKKKVFWTPAEIANAITLRYLSIRAYNYVRTTMKIPLPGNVSIS